VVWFCALLTVLAAQATSASTVRRLTLDELVAAADVVLIGRVEGVASGLDPAVDEVYTYVTLDATEVFKGPLTGGPLVVKQLGGMTRGRGLHVPGQAEFRAGDEVLVFLVARPRDGTLHTIGLWQGKWAVETDRFSGQRVAVNVEPTTGGTMNRRALGPMRSELARLGGTAMSRSADITLDPAERPRQSAAFVLNDPPIRWRQSSVRVNVETGVQPGLAGGGLGEIAAAVGQWNAMRSSLTLAAGTRLPRRCQNSLGTEILITFDDPCDEISGDPGVVAVAAFGFDPDLSQVIGGRTFFAITDAVITTSSNSSVQPLLRNSPCFQSTLAHELGHAIGLDHTPDPAALMYFAETGVCFQGPIQINADDAAGLYAIYPPAGGTPPPPPSGGTPGQPTVNSVAAVSGILNVAWTAGSGPSPTSHRLDFYSGSTLVASVPVGATRSAAIPIPPGTQGTFSVRVVPFNGATAGTASAAFPFTLGAPAPPPPPGCTSAPGAPSVTGSIVNGAATVRWNAVSGALYYIVSAGSSQGGTNVYPPTNVGSNLQVGASGLPPGFSAWVRVRAVNDCGQSQPGDFFLTSGSAPPPTTPPTPPPTTPPSPPPATGASIVFNTSSNACGCWFNPITLRIDGNVVGTMTCNGSAGPFSVGVGSHTYQACDFEGCVNGNTSLTAGGTSTVTLRCQ
jgi:hypothetical protein